jgi:hypothetical protein
VPAVEQADERSLTSYSAASGTKSRGSGVPEVLNSVVLAYSAEILIGDCIETAVSERSIVRTSHCNGVKSIAQKRRKRPVRWGLTVPPPYAPDLKPQMTERCRPAGDSDAGALGKILAL